MNLKELRPLIAEFVATALFVFIGAGSIVANALTNSALGVVGIAAAHGVALAVLITMVMSVSGGHLNPAVTFALWVAEKIDALKMGQYILAQLAGAVVGALLVKGFFPAGAARVTSLGAPMLSGTVGFFDGAAIEALLAFFLVSAVFGTAVSAQAPKVGGFGIGLTLFVCGLTAGPLTGAAANPARAFGPAVVGWEWHGHAAYWIGPLLGALAAAALWKYVLLPRDATEIGG